MKFDRTRIGPCPTGNKRSFHFTHCIFFEKDYGAGPSRTSEQMCHHGKRTSETTSFIRLTGGKFNTSYSTIVLDHGQAIERLTIMNKISVCWERLW